MKYRTIVLYILLFISTNIFSQNKDDELLSFMVYGNDFLTGIALPNTWTVDMNYANQIGVNGFFYLRNYTIDNSPAVIILSLAYKPNDETSLKDWIDYDINEFLEYYKGFIAEKLSWSILNKNNYKIEVFCLSDDKMGYLQYSAYFDVGLHYFANIYVTIKDKNKHDEIVNDFIKSLENSRFTGIGIKVE
jgi:hypothetical protein